MILFNFKKTKKLKVFPSKRWEDIQPEIEQSPLPWNRMLIEEIKEEVSEENKASIDLTSNQQLYNV